MPYTTGTHSQMRSCPTRRNAAARTTERAVCSRTAPGSAIAADIPLKVPYHRPFWQSVAQPTVADRPPAGRRCTADCPRIPALFSFGRSSYRAPGPKTNNKETQHATAEIRQEERGQEERGQVAGPGGVNL